MITALLALLVLLALPGLATIWVPLADQRSRLGRDANCRSPRDAAAPAGLDLAEVVGVAISASFLLSSIVAFTLVMLGWFSLWALLGIVGFYTVAAAALTLRRHRGLMDGWPPKFTARNPVMLVAVLGIMVSLVALYSQTSENVLLHRDPSAYVNAAVYIAENGASLIEDDLYYSLSNEVQQAFVFKMPADSQAHRVNGHQMNFRLQGFLANTEQRKTTPQFFNLYPTWQAVGYSLLGMPGTFLVSPLFGALSVLLIFLVGRRLFGTVAGAVAAALLSVNLAHIWYAKTPASEAMTQTIFLSAVLLWAIYFQSNSSKNKVLGILAGLSLGSMALIRIDFVIVIGAATALILYMYATRRLHRRDLYFIIPLISITALGVAGALHTSLPYLTFSYQTTPHRQPILVIAVVVMLAAVAIGTFPALRVGPFLSLMELRHGLKIRISLAVALMALAAYAYFIRPLGDPVMMTNLFGNIVTSRDEDSLVYLGWYLSAPGLFLAVVGGAVALSLKFNSVSSLLLVTGLTVTIYYLVDPRIRPDHFWIIRRFLPVAIPLCLLFIGLSVQTLGWGANRDSTRRSGDSDAEPDNQSGYPKFNPIRRWLQDNSIRKGVAIGLVVALFALSLSRSWEFVSYREWQGSTSVVASVAELFPPDAVIAFEHSELGTKLAPPLKFLHGLDTFVMASTGQLNVETVCEESATTQFRSDAISCALSRLAEASAPRPLYWVSRQEGLQPDIIQEQFQRVPGLGITIAVPKMEEADDRLPKRANAYTLNLSGVVYRMDR